VWINGGMFQMEGVAVQRSCGMVKVGPQELGGGSAAGVEETGKTMASHGWPLSYFEAWITF
jgi:hypothetical protein